MNSVHVASVSKNNYTKRTAQPVTVQPVTANVMVMHDT